MLYFLGERRLTGAADEDTAPEGTDIHDAMFERVCSQGNDASEVQKAAPDEAKSSHRFIVMRRP